MLTIYRRHRRNCPHRKDGRKYRRCQCPIWVDGRLNGEDIHKSLRTNNWEKSQHIVRNWEAEGNRAAEGREREPITLFAAWQSFLADLEARNLRPSTVRKFELLS